MGLSVDAFWTLILATVLVVVLGPWAAVAFVVPVVLLAMSWRAAQASKAHTQPTFTSRDAWRDAERGAVAAAIPGAFFRHVRPGRPD